MSPLPEDGWAREIRDYLLGRLASERSVDDLPRVKPTRLDHPPIQRWWIFEGKRYKSLGGTLASNLPAVLRTARRLASTFNPRLRISDKPDGVVDWGQTLARGGVGVHPEYVVVTSGVGLREEERAALDGWLAWVRGEWAEYSTAAHLDHQELDWASVSARANFVRCTEERLRRWAHTARRSRWALLRDVVAESLRPVLEPDDLDRIPLPSKRERLFELLCLVRIARLVAPVPRDLRWLDAEQNQNMLLLNEVTCRYQEPVARDAVLATPYYAGSLATAVDTFGVRVPHIIDLTFEFDEPRAGFNGLIVEAKSGRQQFADAVPQLRAYGGARKRRPGSRYLIWGIIEQREGPYPSVAELVEMVRAAPAVQDVWVFSTASDISSVLLAAFGSSRG